MLSHFRRLWSQYSPLLRAQISCTHTCIFALQEQMSLFGYRAAILFILDESLILYRIVFFVLQILECKLFLSISEFPLAIMTRCYGCVTDVANSIYLTVNREQLNTVILLWYTIFVVVWRTTNVIQISKDVLYHNYMHVCVFIYVLGLCNAL
jgi:hypothetical protein